MFTLADCPIEIFEEDAAAEADVDIFEVDDDGGFRGRFAARRFSLWLESWC